MKIKIKYALLALVLGMGAFFMPASVYAAEPDTTPPVIHAELTDGILHIEADDADSGVDAVYIGGKRINYRVDSAVDLEFADLAGTDSEKVGIYAIDFAGNQSKTVEVKNPYYKVAQESKPFTPDGQATVVDNATDGDGKEFYTFTTPEENVFYLVIDRQRGSENVYFLNAVTENDLMALAEKEESSAASESTVTEMTVCSCTAKCEAGEVNTACPVCKNDLKACTGKAVQPPAEEPEPEPQQPEKRNGGTMVFILLAAAIAGGAGYYLKIYKPKHDLDDAEDLDDLLDDDDGPEINEDAGLPGQKEDYFPESGERQESRTDADTIAYDDYPDDGPEQGD